MPSSTDVVLINETNWSTVFLKTGVSIDLIHYCYGELIVYTHAVHTHIITSELKLFYSE